MADQISKKVIVCWKSLELESDRMLWAGEGADISGEHCGRFPAASHCVARFVRQRNDNGGVVNPPLLAQFSCKTPMVSARKARAHAAPERVPRASLATYETDCCLEQQISIVAEHGERSDPAVLSNETQARTMAATGWHGITQHLLGRLVAQVYVSGDQVRP